MSKRQLVVAAGSLPEENGSTSGQATAASISDTRQTHEASEGSPAKVQALQQQLDSALQRAASAEKAAQSAKEAAATELALMRRQLTSAQAALTEAEQVTATWYPTSVTAM